MSEPQQEVPYVVEMTVLETPLCLATTVFTHKHPVIYEVYQPKVLIACKDFHLVITIKFRMKSVMTVE
jgi:hypothetical protein